MNWLRNRKTVVIHSGNFHADDIFSVATLSLFLKKKLKIIRTRNKNIFLKGDYLLDVGGIYDPLKNKFDHHQMGGAGKRVDGVPYATFGLVWKEFGVKISGSQEASDIIEKKLVEIIDANDNAYEISQNLLPDLKPYTISDYIIYLNSICEDKDRDRTFKRLVDFAKDIIEMEVTIANRFLIDHKKVESIYFSTVDKRLIILDHDYDWNGILSDYPEPLFVVKPSPDIQAWKIYCVKIKGEKFKNRLSLPEAWASKRDEELARITNVPDALYCHHQRYMAIAKSKEGAIKLAKLALEEVDNKN